MILYTNILFILFNRNNLNPHTNVSRTLKKSPNLVQIESVLTSRFSILTEFEWSPRRDELSYDYEICTSTTKHLVNVMSKSYFKTTIIDTPNMRLKKNPITFEQECTIP